MKPEPEHFDLERLTAVLRRRGWVILLFTVLLGVFTFAFSEQATKEYTATTAVMFPNPELQQQASGLQVLPTSPTEDPAIMATNIELLTSQAGVASATARHLGLTADAVRKMISASQQGQTSIANVSATSTSPRLAARTANSYVSNFIAIQAAQQQAQVAQALRLVKRQIAGMSSQQLAGPQGQALVDRAESLRILSRLQNGGAQVVTPASAPTSPSSPKVTRNTALGLLIGLLIGLSVAFLLDRLDRRMRTVDDLEEAYRLPLLSVVPLSKSLAKTHHDRQAAPTQHGEYEVFRMLRAYLRYFNVDRKISSVLIASAAPGDGKSTVARNLAEAAQETGTKTLLIDADMRRPTIAAYYGVAPTPGLSEFLSGHVQLSEAIRSVPIATRMNGSTSEVALDVLVAGMSPPNAPELIESNAMSDLLSWATEHYDLVAIDTPPLSVVSDAIPLLPKVDGVVIVSALGRSSRDAAAFLRERMGRVNASLLGVVANRVKDKRTHGYDYGYGNYGGENGPNPVALDEPRSLA